VSFGDREADEAELSNRLIPRVRVELELWRGGERPLGRALSQKAVVGISATSGSGGRSQSPRCERARRRLGALRSTAISRSTEITRTPETSSAEDRLALLPAEPAPRVAACFEFLECGYGLRWASKKVTIRRRASRGDGS
jgi:hypothetical protein